MIVKGVDALPVEHRRKAETHLIGCAPPTTRSRCAGSHTTSSKSSPPRSPKPTSSKPCNARKPSPRRRAGSPSPTTDTACATAGSPCRPVGAILKQAVLAYAAPRHRQHSGTPKGLGHAFCEYVTRYPIDRLPQAGGVDATVVVTMTLENLLGDSHTPALLDTGDRITAAQARQARLRGRDHPGRARRRLQDPRRRTPQAVPPQVPADRDPGPRPALHPLAATGPPHCATSTTTSPGHVAARPTSPTDACCAPATTPTPTHPSTR